MKGELSSPKRRFLQEPHGATSQKTPFFIVTAVNTSNLAYGEVDCFCHLQINMMRDLIKEG
jgi:hypothetical protein